MKEKNPGVAFIFLERLTDDFYCALGVFGFLVVLQHFVEEERHLSLQVLVHWVVILQHLEDVTDYFKTEVTDPGLVAHLLFRVHTVKGYLCDVFQQLDHKLVELLFIAEDVELSFIIIEVAH